MKKQHTVLDGFKLKRLIVVLMIFVAATFSLFAFTACNKTESNFVALKKGGRPNYDSLFSKEDSALINEAMSSSATEEQKKAAVMAMYNVANKSRQQTPMSLMLQNSNAGIAMGDVIMHGFNLKNGDRWYYQLAAQVSTGNAAMDTVMAMFAGLLKVAYTDGNGEYWYSVVNGSQSECDCNFSTFPYATFILTKEPQMYGEADFKTELHYLESMHEINNMKFCQEILADGAEITYNQAEGFYTVKFAVNMKANSELLNEWFALPKEDMAVGGQTLVRYKKYEAVLEVWDNGYAKSFKSNSDREAAMALASGKPVDEFEYIWNEAEIMALLKEDHSIKVHNMFDTIDDYLDYYANPQLYAAKFETVYIVCIVLAAIVLIIIAIVVTVEVLVKKGKLPNLAKKRMLSRAKHIANQHKRREARVNRKQINAPNTSGIESEEQDE